MRDATDRNCSEQTILRSSGLLEPVNAFWAALGHCACGGHDHAHISIVMVTVSDLQCLQVRCQIKEAESEGRNHLLTHIGPTI
jgi:hypothetical protein